MIKNYMIKIYAYWIEREKKQIEDIPEAYREPVANYLVEKENQAQNVSKMN